MKALPLNAWSNRGRRDDIKTECSLGDIYRYQAIQGAFPTKPTVSMEGCPPTVFFNLGETLLSCHHIIADSDVVF